MMLKTNLPSIWTEKSCKNLKKKKKRKKRKEKSLSKDAECYKDAKRGGGGGRKWLKHSLKPSMRS